MPYTYSASSVPDDELYERRRCLNCGLQKLYRWCFLLSSVGNSLMLIGLTAADLLTYINDNNKSSFTFDIAILFIGLVAGWFAFHGVVFEYQYDICLHLISMPMALIYCWLDYSYSGVTFPKIKLIRGIVASSLLIPAVLFSLCVTCSEYWTEFYIVGASEEILTMYKKLRLFLSLLKFDLQTIVIMGIFTLKNGSESRFLEVLPLIVILIYGILFWIMVSYGVQNEHPLPLFIFVLGSIAPPIWVTYKFVSENCFTVLCSRVEAGFNYAVFTAGFLAVIVRMFILVELMKVYKNFGYGLSDRGATAPIFQPRDGGSCTRKYYHTFSYLTSPESTSLLGRPRRGSL